MGELLTLPTGKLAFRRPPWVPLAVSDESLLDAVRAYVGGVSEHALGRMLRLPESAMRANHDYWLQSPEWSGLVDMVLPTVRGVMCGALTRIATLALVQLEERLTHGDEYTVTDKEGNSEVRYRKIKGKDLIEISTRALEQTRNLERMLGRFTDDEGRISMDELAESLRAYAKQKNYDNAKDITPA